MFCGEALLIPPSEREKVLGTLHQSHQGITKTQLLAHGCVFSPGINKAIEEAVLQYETCMRFHAKNAATPPLTPTTTPSHPWQICASDIFTLDGVEYLIFADFYSKVILVSNLPAGQTNSAKSSTSWRNGFVIMVHQKSYTKIMAHSMLVLPLQIAALNGSFTHEISSPHYPQSNGFAESCVKSQAYTAASQIH